MSETPPGTEVPSDAELITKVRAGVTESYGELYRRHVGSATAFARQLANATAEADDLVAEAFTKVLDALRAGKGPELAFRSYLLTTLRNVAYERHRRAKPVTLSNDLGEVPDQVETQASVFEDIERSLAAKAFQRLPERWQAVLWYTEIEGHAPAEVAPLLGLNPNGVSALAYRAREGLRQAYLQVHLADTENSRCRATVERLGAWTRSRLSKREAAQVEAHLDTCEQCRALAAELVDLNGALRAAAGPLVLGVGAAGYLASAASDGGIGVAGAGLGGAAGTGGAGSVGGTGGAGGGGSASAGGAGGAAGAGGTGDAGAGGAGGASAGGAGAGGAGGAGAGSAGGVLGQSWAALVAVAAGVGAVTMALAAQPTEAAQPRVQAPALAPAR
ncbi:sigma-70 family RNA polymerase sigma factor, partial [Crossiella cryophila]|uniref:sigma-70 family RNA polymerase sigma factor n=1 Tax=Crossiella cryophila TaxID=43355 RepID=UPI0031E71F67